MKSKWNVLIFTLPFPIPSSIYFQSSTIKATRKTNSTVQSSSKFTGRASFKDAEIFTIVPDAIIPSELDRVEIRFECWRIYWRKRCLKKVSRVGNGRDDRRVHRVVGDKGDHLLRPRKPCRRVNQVDACITTLLDRVPKQSLELFGPVWRVFRLKDAPWIWARVVFFFRAMGIRIGLNSAKNTKIKGIHGTDKFLLYYWLKNQWDVQIYSPELPLTVSRFEVLERKIIGKFELEQLSTDRRPLKYMIANRNRLFIIRITGWKPCLEGGRCITLVYWRLTLVCWRLTLVCFDCNRTRNRFVTDNIYATADVVIDERAYTIRTKLNSWISML